MSDIVERLREWLSDNPACVEAADEIERLRANLNGRDDFIVDKGLWSEFTDSLKEPVEIDWRGRFLTYGDET